MNKDLESKLGSTIVGRINAVQMSDSHRRATLEAMHNADALIEAFVWVVKKIEQMGERLFLKPSLKH
jgi:hypothetical protein